MEEERQQKIRKRQSEKGKDIEDDNTFCGREVERKGNGKANFTNVTLHNKENEADYVYGTNDFMHIEFGFNVNEDIEDVVFELKIYKDDDTCCFGSTSEIELKDTVDIKNKHKFIVDIDNLRLLRGTYYIDVCIKGNNYEIYDYIHDSVRFEVIDTSGKTGICNMDTKWKFE